MKVLSEARFIELTKAFPNVKPIMVVGDLGIDKYTCGVVNRISPEAPVPILEVTKEWQILGLAANISNNLKALGVPSTLCGIIGDDLNGNNFEHLLEDMGLKTWGLIRDQGRSTVFKERITTEMQQLCRIDYEMKKDIDPETEQKMIDRVKDLSGEHGALILEDYAKGTMTKKLMQDLTRSYKEKGKLVTADPSRYTPAECYKGVDLLKPNQQEAGLLVQSLGYKEKDVGKMAQILVDKLGINMVAITMGGQGIGIIDKKRDGKFKLIPTVSTTVYDVSGAGDTAIGVLTTALAAGATLEEAAWIANCASGVVVGKRGTATVDMDELKEFYARLARKFNGTEL